MKKCPICNSTKIVKNGQKIRCKNCNYVNDGLSFGLEERRKQIKKSQEITIDKIFDKFVMLLDTLKRKHTKGLNIGKRKLLYNFTFDVENELNNLYDYFSGLELKNLLENKK